EIFLAQNARIRSGGRFREQYVARQMSNYHLGVRECEVADRQFFHARAIYSFSQATSTTRANARQSGDTSARSHGYLRVNECIRRARVQDETGRMSVERALNIKMMVRI